MSAARDLSGDWRSGATQEKTADEIANECVLQCYLHGLHLMGPLAGNVLRVSPPLTISESEAKEGLALMHKAFERIAENTPPVPEGSG